MRKLLILIGLLVAFQLQGQLVRTSVVASQGGVAAPVYEAQYQAVLDAMTTDPTGDTLTWGNILVDSLVTYGYFANMHILYIFANTNNGAGEALINWANPGTYDADEAATGILWTKRQGYTGASGDYISTNYNPKTAGLNKNAATIGAYLKIDQQESNSYICYADEADSTIWMSARSGSDNVTSRINANASQTVPGSTDADGMWIGTRRGATDIEVYRNGGSVDTEAGASTGVPGAEMILFTNGVFYSTNQIAIFFVLNAGITDTQAAQLSRFFNTYMTNIGQNEY